MALESKRPENPIFKQMKQRNITYDALAEKLNIPKSTVIDLVAKADGGMLKWKQFEKFLAILHAVGLDIEQGEIK